MEQNPKNKKTNRRSNKNKCPRNSIVQRGTSKFEFEKSSNGLSKNHLGPKISLRTRLKTLSNNWRKKWMGTKERRRNDIKNKVKNHSSLAKVETTVPNSNMNKVPETTVPHIPKEVLLSPKFFTVLRIVMWAMSQEQFDPINAYLDLLSDWIVWKLHHRIHRRT